MKYRKLRIAWSVVCGIACVLLIALWVRSYTMLDQFIAQASSQRYVAIASNGGAIHLYTNKVNHYPTWTWIAERTPHLEYPPWIKLKWTPYVIQLYLPNWILLVLTTAVAAIPWVPWPRRFTLRTLLIATTLVAVVLGLVVWLNHS